MNTTWRGAGRGRLVIPPLEPGWRPLPLSARPETAVRRWPWALLSVVAVLLVIVAPTPLNIIVPLAPIAIAVLLRRPQWAVYALAFSVPFQSLRAFDVSGLQLTTTEGLIGLATIAWCAAAAARGRFATPGRLPWRTALLVFGAAMLISVSQASDVRLSLKELLKWAEMFLTYTLVLGMARSPRDVPRLFLLLVGAGVAEAAVGLAQIGIHGGGVFHAAGVLRAAGTFDQPNPFAGFLNMSLPLALAALLLGLPRYGLLARWAALLSGVAVLISLSRGAWLAILCAATLMAWLALPQRRQLINLGLITLLFIVVASAVGILPTGVANAAAGMFGVSQVDVINPTPVTWSTAERLAHWLAGLGMFASHPFLGVGIGNYASAYKQFQVADVWSLPLGHAHNYYINIAAEAGVVGLGAYLFFLAATFGLCARLWRTATTPWPRTVALGALGVMVTVAVQGFFDNVFVHGMEVQIALVLALVALAERHGAQVDAAMATAKDGP